MLDTERMTIPRPPSGGTTMAETEDKQSVLMALRTIASQPLPPARLSTLLFDQQRHDLQRLIPAVQAYLAAIEAEIGER